MKIIKSLRESLYLKEISSDLKGFIFDLKDNLSKLEEYGHNFSDKMHSFVDSLLK
jgi:hypothetical protein